MVSPWWAVARTEFGKATFSPGRAVGAGHHGPGAGGALTVCPADGGAHVVELGEHAGRVNDAAFSPDGRRVLTASADGTVRIWEAATGRCTAVLSGHQGGVNSVAFHPDGTTIVTAGGRWDGTDLGGRYGLASARDRGGRSARTLRAAPDWGGAAGQACGVQPGRRPTPVHAERPRCHQPDRAGLGRRYGPLAQRGTRHGRARRPGGRVQPRWRPGGGGIVQRRPRGLERDRLQSGHLPADPEQRDGTRRGVQSRRLLACRSPATTRRCGSGTPRRGHRWPSFAGTPTSSPASRSARTGGVPRLARTGRRGSGRPEAGRASPSSTEETAPIVSAAFGPDGSRVLTTSEDGTARVWRTGTDSSLGELCPDEHHPERGVFVPGITLHHDRLSDQAITGVAVESSRAPGSGAPSTATARQRAAARRPDKRRIPERALVFSHDGRRVVTTASEYLRYTSDLLFTAVIRERGPGARSRGWASTSTPVRGAAFSPDNRLIATVSGTDPSIGASDWTLRIWSASDGALLREMRHQHGMRGVWFSRDGQHLFTASERGGVVTVWRADPLTPVATLSGHADLVNSASSSHDGRLVVTASKDGTARVWDLQDGVALMVLRGHPVEVRAAVFEPGRRADPDDGRRRNGQGVLLRGWWRPGA